MKPTKHRSILTLGLLLATLPILSSPRSSAQNDEGGLDVDIMVQVEFIKIDHAALTELFFKRKMKADGTALRDEVTKLIKAGKAEIAETGIITVPSGQRAKAESITEVIYPTEYAPPEALMPVAPIEEKAATGSTKVEGETKDQPGEYESNSGKEESTEPKADERFWPPSMFPTPSSFETRNVGFTLEVDATASARSDLISVSVAPELVTHVGESVLQSVDTPEGKKVDTVKMPIFYTARLHTSRSVKNGAYSLLGAVSPVGGDGRSNPQEKYLVFLRATTMDSE